MKNIPKKTTICLLAASLIPTAGIADRADFIKPTPRPTKIPQAHESKKVKTDVLLTRAEYCFAVQEQEDRYKFMPTEGIEAVFSRIETNQNTVLNSEIILKVWDVPLEKLKLPYKPLKQLMIELSNIRWDKRLSPTKRAELAYNAISRTIKEEEPQEEILSVDELIFNGGGNCDDIASAYLPLLTVAGVHSNLVFGRTIKDGKKESYHAWLTVSTEEGNFDIDPTWYRSFIKLKERLPNAADKSDNDEKITEKKKTVTYVPPRVPKPTPTVKPYKR
ncbi:transglutaminase-like domain-containing protein [Nanoarchaeota archaeon]